MEITVNGQIIEVDGTCDNCHKLTMQIVRKLSGKNAIGNALSEKITENAGTLEFKETIEEGDRKKTWTRFYQWNAEKIPVGSIILFYTQGDALQHSMFVCAKDTWIGANNLSSLGAENCNPLLYDNMSKRTFEILKRGGWDINENMRSFYGDEYKMYYIPIL